MTNNSAPRDANAERFVNPEGFDIVADPSTPHATTGYGAAPNSDGTSITPDKRSRNERVSGARDARGISFGDLRVDPDGTVTAATQETASTSYDAFTTYALPGAGVYPGEPTRILGDDAVRSRVLITNGHDTDSLLVGPLSAIRQGSGFILPPFNVFDPKVQGAIYACIPAGQTNAISIGVWVERDA